MSGSQPIQFVKKSQEKEEQKEETTAGVDSKLPLMAANVMAEKDKVAAALLRGEDYDPFGIAAAAQPSSSGPQPTASTPEGDVLMADLEESFAPSAAADAINAVLAPSASAAGLEAQVEPMESEKVKSDDEWQLADAVPITEADMVGSFLQDQEEKDREQYVFLTEADADMSDVKEKLDSLTEQIHRLSVKPKEELGPENDGPRLVEVAPAGDGLFKLTCFPEPFPHVSRQTASILGNLYVHEVAELFDIFRGKILARSGVERALECYHIVKRCKEHEKLLNRPYLHAKDKTGLGYKELKTAEPGEAMAMICPECLTPRDPVKPSCLFCKSKEPAVHSTQPMAGMYVDGVFWELRFSSDGSYHWEAEGITAEQKEAAMLDVGELAQRPSPSLNPTEASFADQVPQHLRIRIREQVVGQQPDPALVEALAKRNEKPHVKEEEDKQEGQKVFHPGAIKAMKIKQEAIHEPMAPPEVDPEKIEEAVNLTTSVLTEMQTGALSVGDKEALGAQVLRHPSGYGTFSQLVEEELSGWPGGQHPPRPDHN